MGAGFGQRLAEQVGEGPVGVQGLRSTLHQHRIAGSQGEGADLYHRVGAALEDDEQDPDRDPHLLQNQSVVEFTPEQRLPHRVGVVDEHPHALAQGFQLRGRQRQPFEDRSRKVTGPGRFEVELVGGNQVGLPLAEQALEMPQHLGPGLGTRGRQPPLRDAARHSPLQCHGCL